VWKITKHLVIREITYFESQQKVGQQNKKIYETRQGQNGRYTRLAKCEDNAYLINEGG